MEKESAPTFSLMMTAKNVVASFKVAIGTLFHPAQLIYGRARAVKCHESLGQWIALGAGASNAAQARVPPPCPDPSWHGTPANSDETRVRVHPFFYP